MAYLGRFRFAVPIGLNRCIAFLLKLVFSDFCDQANVSQKPALFRLDLILRQLIVQDALLE